MSVKILRRLPARPSRGARPPVSRRNFFSVPDAGPQVLTAQRTLPYPATRVYSLIADVDSYAHFVPYCTSSIVTRWTEADARGRRWPSQADLVVGWGGLTETYTSRLFCVPGCVVEAISGNASPTIAPADMEAYKLRDDGPVELQNRIFDSLVTTWTVRPCHAPAFASVENNLNTEWAEVNLSIRFQFANPLYNLMSSQFADKVAGIMIHAFETRARRVL